MSKNKELRGDVPILFVWRRTTADGRGPYELHPYVGHYTPVDPRGVPSVTVRSSKASRDDAWHGDYNFPKTHFLHDDDGEMVYCTVRRFLHGNKLSLYWCRRFRGLSYPHSSERYYDMSPPFWEKSTRCKALRGDYICESTYDPKTWPRLRALIEDLYDYFNLGEDKPDDQ